MVSAHTVPMFLAVILAASVVSGHQQGSEEQSGQNHGAASGSHLGASGQQQGGRGGSDRSNAARGLNQNHGGESQDASARYVGRIYTDPEYYGYESTFPGGRSNFKAYRSEGSGRSGQDQPGGRKTQEHGKNSPGGGHGQQRDQQQQQQRY